MHPSPRKTLAQLWLTLASLVLIPAQVFAQAEPMKFGKVDLKDLQQISYGKDTSASAVVLCDYGKSYFKYSDNDGFQVFFEHHIRIKILKKSGYDWANGQIPLYIVSNAKKEELTNLKGYTYNLQGNEIIKDKLTKEAVFDEKLTDEWVLKKFTMPNVKEGSVIEYEYTIKSDFAFNFREWEFQKTIPVVWSEYRATIPEYFRYKQMSQGYQPFYINEHNSTQENFTIRIEGETVGGGFSNPATRVPTRYENIKADAVSYRWVTRDVPAFREEPYMTAVRDYLTKIEFELASVKMPGQIEKPFTNNWQTINATLLTSESFGLQLNRGSFLKNDLAAITSRVTDPAQRIAAVYEYVRRTMKWNGQKRLYPESTLKKAFENRSGNSSDINLLLVTMLREAGFMANPLILSTRDHGRVMESYAMLSKFNYVIAHISHEGNEYLLDATDPHTGFGMLPTRCLNGSGRLISKDNPKWVALNTTERATHVCTGRFAISPAGELNGSIEISDGGYNGLNIRKAILVDGQEKYLENVRKSNPTWTINKYTYTGTEEIGRALTAQYELSIDEHAQPAGNLIYLKPMLTKAQKENPFKIEERLFPVDFAVPMDETYSCSFVIPDGYKIEELPKGLVLDLPEKTGRFTYMIGVNGNTVQVSSRITLKKSVFYAPEYQYLREFFHQIVSKHAEQVVLKKI